MRLTEEFYLQTDVVAVARALIGMVLITERDGRLTAGRITETEAYRAPEDKGSHAYGNRRTARTAVMFQSGGRAYIYRCYGIHAMFNIVTGEAEMPHAVLVRAVEPLEGADTMLERRGGSGIGPQLTTGPGVLCRAMGIELDWNGLSLTASDAPVWLEDRGVSPAAEAIAAGKRIGIDYAGEWADMPWRFWDTGSEYFKKPK